MPMHDDFEKIYQNFIRQYGEEEGKKNYYAWLQKMGYDDTKPMPKEKVREHVQAILPFKVLEKIVDKPLRIRGIAMTAGMSRNFNIYTPQELQNFANKLVSAIGSNQQTYQLYLEAVC
jgi:hypothetical protein